MSMSDLYYSILNPLMAVEVNPTNNTALYATRHIDDFLFEDQIYKWQNKIPFYQPWLNEDIIRLQFESDFGLVNIDLYDQYDRLQTGYSAVANVIRMNKYLSGMSVYEVDLSLVGLGIGPWRYIITPGLNPAKAMKTEWFCIRPNNNDTIRLDYFNSTYHEDVIFETGIKFSLRIPGYIKYDAPGNKLVTIENQVLSQTIVSAKRFRNIVFYVGDGGGVPPWLIDKINAAATCDNFALDNKLFSLSDGKWSPYDDPEMQLAGYSTNLRESISRSSKIVSGTIDPSKRITVIHNITGKLFGDVSSDSGETVIQILDQEP